MTGVQKLQFPSGGFVLHKIRIIGSTCRFSAWYDADGKLIDSLAITAKGVELEPSESQKLILQNMGVNSGKSF